MKTQPTRAKLIKEGPQCDTWLWEHGKQIEISLPVIDELAICEIHVKPDGSIDDKPSLCIVMENQIGIFVATQITFESIWPAIEAAIKSKGALS